jgi:uncharacterized protein (TIRG00374 family)
MTGRLALGGVLGVSLLAFFLRGVEWSALAAAFRQAKPWYLAGVVLATVLCYVIRSWRWGYLLAPLAEVPLPRLVSVTVVGFMAGLLVPRAGEILRPYLVGRRHGIRTSAAFASIILERLFDLITVLVLFALYLYVLPVPEQQTRGPLLGALKAGGALAALAAAAVAIVLAVFHAHADRAVAVIDRVLAVLPARLARPISNAVRAFTAGLAVLQAPARHLLAIAGQSLLTWLAIALSVYWGNRAFGIDLPFHAAFLIIGFLTVGVAVPTPGNVGGFHESYRIAVTQAFGVAPQTAVAAGIALHALTNLPVLLFGLVFLYGEGLTFGKVAQMADTANAGEKQA